MTNIPNHIAIVMDGNNRWAKAHSLPRLAGHKKGTDVANDITRIAKKIGVNYLTLYTFSSENWNRPQDEVNDLMNLLRSFLKNDVAKLTKEGIRVRFIGDRTRLADDIQELCRKTEELTKNNKFQLVIALSYGSRDEIKNAAKMFAQDVVDGKTTLDDSENFSNYLYAPDIPDPDLVIRTSNEHRISNFLLWQIAYSELYFTESHWPDFNEEELMKAINEYGQRERRFGTRS